jgi:hypothetical protein
MNYIEVEITEAMRVEAEEKAKKLGELKNSITRGEGNVAGHLGELIAQKVIGGDIVGTRDYDIVTKDGVKWDVKTKRCAVVPQDHFECSVTNYNTTQKCDRYIFVRVLKDYTKGWVIGELPHDEYYAKATFIEQGQYDPRNKWRALCDCWNVPFTDLNEVVAAKPDPEPKPPQPADCPIATQN